MLQIVAKEDEKFNINFTIQTASKNSKPEGKIKGELEEVLSIPLPKS